MILKPNIHEEKKVHQTKKDKPQSTRSLQQKTLFIQKALVIYDVIQASSMQAE